MELEIANYYFKPSSILENIPRKIYRELKNGSTMLNIPQNEFIYQEGSYPKGLYIIKKGAAKLFILDSEGREQIIFMMTRGEMFGYRPILCNDNSSVFVTAIEDCEIILINKDIFLKCIHKSDELSSLFLNYFGNEFRILANKIALFALKPVQERVALTLLVLNQKFNGIGDPQKMIQFTKRDIANYTGISPETLSRQLTKLKGKKIVTIKGRKIFLNDVQALFEIANI